MAPSVVAQASSVAENDSIPTTKADLPPGLTLIPAEKLDTRSDQEIESWLQTRHPITSDKNVWCFWNTGFDKIRPWAKRNIIGWVRRLGPEWNVNFVDKVEGSPTCIYNYVDESFFPEAFNKNTMDGEAHIGPHQGDLVRLPLLWKYGGVWMDAGIMLFRSLDELCWNEIENPDSPYEIGGFLMPLRQDGGDSFLNGFIAVKRNNAFIKKWHDIYVSVWGTSTNQHGFSKHPLLKHLPLLSPAGSKLSFEDDPAAAEMSWAPLADYLAHFLCFERLRKLVDPSDGFNGPEYYAKHFWLVQSMQEMYLYQNLTMWYGPRQFELLSAKRSGDDVVKDETWQAAEQLVTSSLANTAMMKISHGPGGTPPNWLAHFWDKEENKDADHAENTFAAYLRYGSERYEQTRTIEPVQPPTTSEEILHAGILEPKKD